MRTYLYKANNCSQGHQLIQTYQVCLDPQVHNGSQNKMPHWSLLEDLGRDFPGGPMAKSLPCNARDTGLIPGWGTKIPHVVGQLSQLASTRESTLQFTDYTIREKPVCCNRRSQMLKLRPDMANKYINKKLKK